jgi:multidrug resistance efflux pump
VLIAPEAGQVGYIRFLQVNQLVAQDQELFYVQPPATDYYAELAISQKGIGKIRNGQQVILKVEGYPDEEYGYLKGVVNYISEMPGKSDSFWIKVNLPQQLKTNYNKEIAFRNNLLARAQVITDDKKLFDRMIGVLKQLER